MVSVGLRTAFNEHLFEKPEQDANTALTELDKGSLHVLNGQLTISMVKFYLYVNDSFR